MCGFYVDCKHTFKQENTLKTAKEFSARKRPQPNIKNDTAVGTDTVF